VPPPPQDYAAHHRQCLGLSVVCSAAGAVLGRGVPAPVGVAASLLGSTAGRVLAVADDDTSIKVSRRTRERLARLAAERGATLKDVVAELAAATLTAAELAEREQRARAVLARHFGIEVTEAELAASARLREMISRRETTA